MIPDHGLGERWGTGGRGVTGSNADLSLACGSGLLAEKCISTSISYFQNHGYDKLLSV